MQSNFRSDGAGPGDGPRTKAAADGIHAGFQFFFFGIHTRGLFKKALLHGKGLRRQIYRRYRQHTHRLTVTPMLQQQVQTGLRQIRTDMGAVHQLLLPLDHMQRGILDCQLDTIGPHTRPAKAARHIIRQRGDRRPHFAKIGEIPGKGAPAPHAFRGFPVIKAADRRRILSPGGLTQFGA